MKALVELLPIYLRERLFVLADKRFFIETSVMQCGQQVGSFHLLILQVCFL